MITSPGEGGSEIWKIKEGGGSMVQGKVFLKGGEAGASTFPIWLYQGLSFLHLEITLPLESCVMHLKKNYFFCHHNFMKKIHPKLTKNEPENIL